MPLQYQWLLIITCLPNWWDSLWITMRFSLCESQWNLAHNEIFLSQEKDRFVCIALLRGHFRYLVPQRCSAVPICCQQWPELFLSTLLKVQGRLNIRRKRSNSSRGSVPGSLTSETRTKQLLPQFLWKAQQIIALPLYFLIRCFPPISTPFIISLWCGFYSSSL